SATQGCKALKEEKYRLVLLNSNPATVMTDPEFSDRTYVEPMTPEVAADIIVREHVDAILPTLGGQTALNLAMELHARGYMDPGVKMIGSTPEVIEIAENRSRFRETMTRLGLDIPVSGLASTVEEAVEIAKKTRFPAVIRPSFTLGGTGGGVAYNLDELTELAWRGLTASPIRQILVEESLIGWKEMELEMIRDLADNAIIVCGIENVDPMGVHTGDSVTVAPIQTLTDVEYQAMRDESLRVARAVGLNGGCNIQFAVNPKTGRRVVIEMNPRVSRSSALASKATGFPIARVASKLAVGYTLGELKNGITGKSACFEPALDYCVVKAPRFNFEKFAGASSVLGLEMKAVGETMALGGNFREALQKALRGLEIGLHGLGAPVSPAEAALPDDLKLERLKEKLVLPLPERLSDVYSALRLGLPPAEACLLTGLDPWFVSQIELIIEAEETARGTFAETVARGGNPPAADWRHLKAQGLSDIRLAKLINEASPGLETSAEKILGLRLKAGVVPHFRQVDTCAGEFEAGTPYYYSSYDSPVSPMPAGPGDSGRPKEPGRGRVMILGGGPNRIGQGIEFDYCCVKATQAFAAMGLETVMVNSNPETVSTDYDAVGRLYFEPVTLEDVLAVYNLEKPDGVIVQLGGQTPLNLAMALKDHGVDIWGTDPASIFRAENRRDWNELVEKLKLNQPPSGMARDAETAAEIAKNIGYPVIVRPSFVLGGRAMCVIYQERELADYVSRLAVSGSEQGLDLDSRHLILVDKFLEGAVEVDVDAVADGGQVVIAAIMEHIERAGIHSGDSCCSIPTFSLPLSVLNEIRSQTHKLGLELGVRGLMNIQFAVTKDSEIYVLEANPRASRTAPFVAKATGCPIIEVAAKVMAGRTLEQIGFTKEPHRDHVAVKEAVLPWSRFQGTQVVLGPEMRSTGEVMGIDNNFGIAFLKSQIAAGMATPQLGNVVMTVCDADKPALKTSAAKLARMGYDLFATQGTARYLGKETGVKPAVLSKLGSVKPNLVDFLGSNPVQFVLNTTSGQKADRDSVLIRAEAIKRGIPLITTMAGLTAAVTGLEALVELRAENARKAEESGPEDAGRPRKYSPWGVTPLQDYHNPARDQAKAK
ncbi:MAG: carbamoyl-phosphate synthase large subunit, partial [Deltaproteobacteria bacterium]|nr:carbamoyl-phosphate synthase large subunit [Deltaproteobacteria bacterium]